MGAYCNRRPGALEEVLVEICRRLATEGMAAGNFMCLAYLKRVPVQRRVVGIPSQSF